MIDETVTYMRYSDTKQDDGYSIEYQTTEIEEFAKRNGLTIHRNFIDKAQTATKVAGREEFFALIRAVKAGQVKTIIVYKMNRMFRNTYESSKYRLLFREMGVRILCVTQTIDEDTSSGRLTTNIVASVDQYTSENISDHVKSSMREMARQGYYTGGTVRFGYTLAEEAHGIKKRRKYAPHPVEAPIVQRIYQMYADGMSVWAIRDTLNEDGFKTKKGKEFSTSILSRIIRDDVYIGVYRYKTQGYDEIVVENGVVPLVDKMLWLQANDRLKKMQDSFAPKARKKRHFYTLTGKIFCASCNAPFIGYSAGTEKRGFYQYYCCKNRKVHGTCNAKFIRKEIIETETISSIKANILNADRISQIAQEIIAMLKDSPDELDKKIKEYSAQKKTLENSLKNIVKLFAVGEKTAQLLQEQSAEIEADIAQLELRIFSMTEQRKNSLTEEIIVSYLTDFLSKSSSTNTDEMKTIFDTFVSEIVLSDSEIKIRLNEYGNIVPDTFAAQTADGIDVTATRA